MLAGLFDAARDAVAVQRPQGFERLEYHQRERPCQTSVFSLVCFLLRFVFVIGLPMGKV